MWSLVCVFGFGSGFDCLVKEKSLRSGVGGVFVTAKGIWERRAGFGSPGNGEGCVPCLSCGGWARRWILSLHDLVAGLAGLVGRGSGTLCCNYRLEGVPSLSCGHGHRLSLTDRCVSSFPDTGLALAELEEVD